MVKNTGDGKVPLYNNREITIFNNLQLVAKVISFPLLAVYVMGHDFVSKCFWIASFDWLCKSLLVRPCVVHHTTILIVFYYMFKEKTYPMIVSVHILSALFGADVWISLFVIFLWRLITYKLICVLVLFFSVFVWFWNSFWCFNYNNFCVWLKYRCFTDSAITFYSVFHFIIEIFQIKIQNERLLSIHLF